MYSILIETEQIVQLFEKQMALVLENATHVIASLATAAQDGRAVDAKAAEFLAGIEAIAQKLPNSRDAIRKSNVMRALAGCQIDNQGNLNQASELFAKLGQEKYELLGKYQNLIRRYIEARSGKTGSQPTQQLVQALRKLQMDVDVAMRSTRF